MRVRRKDRIEDMDDMPPTQDQREALDECFTLNGKGRKIQCAGQRQTAVTQNFKRNMQTVNHFASFFGSLGADTQDLDPQSGHLLMMIPEAASFGCAAPGAGNRIPTG